MGEDVNFYEMIFSSNISNLKNKIICNVWLCKNRCRILFKLGTCIKHGIYILNSAGNQGFCSSKHVITVRPMLLEVFLTLHLEINLNLTKLFVSSS